MKKISDIPKYPSPIFCGKWEYEKVRKETNGIMMFRFINTRNRQNISYRLKMNHFGDVTDKEMTHYKGLLNDSRKDNESKPFVAPNLHTASHLIPLSLDWRDYGKMKWKMFMVELTFASRDTLLNATRQN